MAKKLINTEVKIGEGVLIKEALNGLGTTLDLVKSAANLDAPVSLLNTIAHTKVDALGAPFPGVHCIVVTFGAVPPYVVQIAIHGVTGEMKTRAYYKSWSTWN